MLDNKIIIVNTVKQVQNKATLEKDRQNTKHTSGFRKVYCLVNGTEMASTKTVLLLAVCALWTSLEEKVIPVLISCVLL